MAESERHMDLAGLVPDEGLLLRAGNKRTEDLLTEN